MSALLSPYELLTPLETVRRAARLSSLFRKDYFMDISKIKERFELLILVSIFVSTVYAVAPAV